MMREEEVKELEWAVGNQGAQMEVVWVGEGQRQAQTPGTPKLRDVARGAELIGGTVRQRGKKGYVAGKVIGFEGTEYEVRLSSGQQVKWSEEEVRHGWVEDQYIMRRGWTAKDQRTMQEGVRGVLAKTVKEKRHRHISQFPSRIDGREWEVKETWYTCTTRALTVGRAKTLLMEGKDLQAAKTARYTRNFVLGAGKDLAGMDSSLADDQDRMVGEGNGSKKGRESADTGNPQRTERRVPQTGRHKGGRTSQHQSGAGVEAETGLAGDGPHLGGTGGG